MGSFSDDLALLTLDSLKKKVDLLAIAQHYKLSDITSLEKREKLKK